MHVEDCKSCPYVEFYVGMSCYVAAFQLYQPNAFFITCAGQMPCNIVQQNAARAALTVVPLLAICDFYAAVHVTNDWQLYRTTGLARD